MLVVEFGLLGPLLVRDGARRITVSAPRQRVLLAALLLEAGRAVSLDALADSLWDGEPPAGARGALHSAVQRLRVSLGPSGAAVISTRPAGYCLDLADGEFDVAQFTALAGHGHAAAEAGLWEQAAVLLGQALELWRGEPLADIPSRLLREREAARLNDQRLRALAARVNADLQLGRHDAVVPELRQLTAAYPLREGVHAQLMLALYRSARQADALAVYQGVQRVLADELGIDPGPELKLLYQRILAADPQLMSPAAGQPPAAASGQASARRPQSGPGQPAAANGRGGPAAADLVIPRQLPAGARHFAGRDEELKWLSALAAQAAGDGLGVLIAAIDGTAGVGKTALAVHFAHQVARQFPDGQLYVNLRGVDPAGVPMPAGEAVRQFLGALGVQAGRIPASLDAQAALYRSLLAGRRVLVLLDNARDVDQVRPLLPASPGCLVLVTSRSQLTGLVAAEGASPLSLGVLGDADAHELLARRLGAGRIAADMAAAAELTGLCARLPLALSIAAARIASQPGLSLASLAAELRDAGGRLDALDTGHAAASVRAVFSWSYEQLDPQAAMVFRTLGLHPGPDVSVRAAAALAGLPERDGHRSLTELTRAQLLTEHAAGRFGCHDLLRAYAAERAHADLSAAGRHAAQRRMLDHYLHTACRAAALLLPARSPILPDLAEPTAAPEPLRDAAQALEWLAAEREVLMASAARALEAGFAEQAWQLALTLTYFLDLRGHWHDLGDAGRIALTAARLLGDGAAQAQAHAQCGLAQARLGDYPEAHRRLAQALDGFTTLGDKPGQARVHNALAVVLDCQGRYGEALDQAQLALAAAVAAGDEAAEAQARNAVGWFHAQLRQYDEALDYCGQALKQLHALGLREAEARTLDSIGYAHQHLGHHVEAAACYQRSLGLNRETGSRPGEAETLTHIGDARWAAGQLADARAAWEQALEILENLRHPHADLVRGRLARPADGALSRAR
ncbi:MAG: AfsR/SARP family transcriptional regulator [Streptosporangiaceae bacterium]